MFTQYKYFETPVYFLEKKEWLNDLISNTDSYIEKAKKDVEDSFGMSYHSQQLYNDKNFLKFNNFICDSSFKILDEQGYDVNHYAMHIQELWVQEFSEKGGGHHNSHVHSNSHINGFYFLKCSENTSYPVFHDPRSKKRMIHLIEKDTTKLTTSSDTFHIKPQPGLFVFFNAYLEHQFVVDKGTDPFRFIHFNIQAIPKQFISK